MTIIVPYIYQRYASGCKIQSILYADDSYLMCQHRDVEEIEKQLNKNFKIFAICSLTIN